SRSPETIRVRASRFVAQLQPTLLPREPKRFDAIADTEFADRFGKIIAHGALRKIEPRRDVTGRKPLTGESQHLTLSIVERIGFGPCLDRERGIDRAAAAMDLAQRVGELLGRRVLE